MPSKEQLLIAADALEDHESSVCELLREIASNPIKTDLFRHLGSFRLESSECGTRELGYSMVEQITGPPIRQQVAPIEREHHWQIILTDTAPTKWRSIAVWPEGVIIASTGKSESSDIHDSREAAEAACRRLRRDGFGGNGEHFPLSLRVEPVE